MDGTQVAVAAIAACAIVFPAYWSRKASKQTAPVNGQSVSQQVDQLHRLFVAHADADSIQFKAGQLRDGELAEAIIAGQTYNRDRWHKDDSRYTVMLGLVTTLASTELSDGQKMERFRALRESAEEHLKWDGHERRETP